MSSHKVLDSYAIMAFFENEPGASKVAELIKQARDKGRPLLLSVVNWGEVYYVIARAAGQSVAEEALKTVDTLPIEIVPIDREIAKIAAEFKSTRKMSYADCFAAALAKLKKADLVTGDKEFKEVEDQINVLWL